MNKARRVVNRIIYPPTRLWLFKYSNFAMNFSRRIHSFHRLYSVSKIHRTYFKTPPHWLNKPPMKLGKPSFFGTMMLASLTVKCVSESEEPQVEELPSVYVKSRLEESCLSSVSQIMNLLDEISIAVTNCSMQYKICLNELIKSLETYRALEQYSIIREECEEAMIVARANVTDSKKEFLDLITILESVSKVAYSVSELSFLLGAESLALKLFDVLSTLKTQANEEMEDLKNLENKYLLLEKSFIEETKFQ